MNMRRRGDRGEAQAVDYLEKKGCTVLARNHCVRGGEVDIIFADADTTVFCEVKLRTQQRFGAGTEAVDEKKRKCICRAALDWAYKHDCLDSPMRFDVIVIYGNTITHYSHAFEFIEP